MKDWRENFAKYTIVVTTINAPTRAIQEIARDRQSVSAEFMIVGDSKPPPTLNRRARPTYPSTRKSPGFQYGKIAPEKHYARKNVGYIAAARNGATVIIETDDNIPFPAFWEPWADALTSRT